jgi:hypothetical protein
MEAYIQLGSYRSDFDARKTARSVKDSKLSTKKWAEVIPEDGDLELRPTEGLHLYGGKKALLRALQHMKGSAAHWRIIGESWHPLMIAYGVVRVDGDQPKRVLMICHRTDERVAEIGEGKLLADNEGNTSPDSIYYRDLIAIITALPDSKDL